MNVVALEMIFLLVPGGVWEWMQGRSNLAASIHWGSFCVCLNNVGHTVGVYVRVPDFLKLQYWAVCVRLQEPLPHSS